MACYTVHMPINGALETRLDRTIFVRDGFSFGAFSLGAFWFLAKGHWLIALLLWGAYGVLVFALVRFGLTNVIFPVTFLLAILLGFEAASLQRLGLSCRKFEEVGLITGDKGDALEQRFFSNFLARNADAPMRTQGGTATPYMSHIAPQNAVLGLFPHPHRGFSA